MNTDMDTARNAWYAELSDSELTTGWKNIGPDEVWREAWDAAKSLAIKCDDRAIRLASLYAEEWIRAEGEPTGAPDEYTIPDCLLGANLNDCIDHLCWHGAAVRHHREDGYTIVQFGDFTLSGDDTDERGTDWPR